MPILYQKNSANDFKIDVSEDNKSINISFDYFDFEEGIVLQIFHTGNSSKDISLTGTIKSVKSIKRKDVLNALLPSILVKVLRRDNNRPKRKIMNRTLGWGTIAAGIFILFALPLISQNPQPVIENSSSYKTLLTSLLGIPYIWFGYRILKRHIPKGFDIFNEEF